MTEKLSNTSAYQLLHSSVAKCDRAPQHFSSTGIFLINTASVRNIADIKSDLNGRYSGKIETKRKKVVDVDGQLKVISEVKKDDVIGQDDMVMVVDRYRHERGLIRNIIFIFKGNESDIIGQSCILQYYIDQAIAGTFPACRYLRILGI